MAIKTFYQELNDNMRGPKILPNPSFKPQEKIDTSNDVLMSFDSEEERNAKLQQIRQQKLLAHQWVKIGYETAMEQIGGTNQVKVMYRDADLMNMWPEIGTALDIISEECCTYDKNEQMLHVHSKSAVVKSVLEDLFTNRLDIDNFAPMIIRDICQYGNEFMFLNIEGKRGITGWRQLPVHEMSRLENGMLNAYSGAYGSGDNAGDRAAGSVRFVWEGHSEGQKLFYWQVAHFRRIKESIYLPYGCSMLNKARRHWRMLSMMEDAMLIYRLERSIERRIFKVNVGLIDDADIPAYLQEFMNTVKRAPIIDPGTGQVDLRKNFLDVTADYVIPVRNGQDPTDISTLQSAQNPTAMDDIEYIENKICTAIRVPKSYLNFTDAKDTKGQNMSYLDIRFSRMIKSAQKDFLMELTKVAMIHLYCLGYADEISNFSLTMNNPSTQMESIELENLTTRLNAATAALAEQGGGIPLMSWHRCQREIMGLTDDEISVLLNEIRLEKAITSELEMTSQIIKRTRLFDRVDRIYGEPGAEYSSNGGGDEEGPGGGGFGGGGGMPMMGGGDFDDGGLGDLGEPGADDIGDIGGNEGSVDLGDMAEGGEGSEPLQERKLPKLHFLEGYLKMLGGNQEILESRPKTHDKTFLISESLNDAFTTLENMMEENKKKNAKKEKEILE